MKTSFSRSTARVVLVLSFLVGGMPANSAWAQSVNSLHDRIVGLWDVQVTNFNCDTGAPLGSIRGFHKYELGGTAQTVNNTNPATQSANLGIWTHIQGNDYTLAFKRFGFDQAGNNTSWSIYRFNVTIDDDATLYAGSGRVETFDANGKLLATGCPTFTGTRFQ
jgi:hypothetical protein